MPTNPETILSLAERIGKASGPDRGLDVLIEWPEVTEPFDLQDGYREVTVTWNGRKYCRSGPVPRYTASLDAAMTLVPEGHSWSLFSDGCAGVELIPDGSGDMPVAHYCGATPALALTAAALRARAAK